MTALDADQVIAAEGLCKRFGKTVALHEFDLHVAEGTVCGLLGPNGAGKTTAVRILATLIRADAGRAWVAGYDVARNPGAVRYRIGLAGQHAAVDEKLTGRDNLRLFGRLYHLSDATARQRADELLERFGLADAADRKAGNYSGGMRRRLDVIASLIVAPPVLFLDEPTTGLDPASRNEIWVTIRDLVRGGTTVLLTTQYLDEADQLAGQITVVDGGRVIASGTSDELKAVIGDRLDVVVHDNSALSDAVAILARVTGAAPQVFPERRLASVALHDGSGALVAIMRELDHAGLVPDDVALRRPTLDEVFLRLTSKSPAEAGEPGSPAGLGQADPPDNPAGKSMVAVRGARPEGGEQS